MLVKFISYTITVFGTKRYKPFLLACSVLVLSLTGISIATAKSGLPIEPTASATQQESTAERAAPQAQAPAKRAPRADESTSDTTNTSAATDQASSTKSNASTAKTAAPDVTLSTSGPLTISKTSPSAAVELTGALTDGTSVSWSVNADRPGLKLSPATTTSAAKLTISISADQASEPQTYQLTVHATDPARNLSLTKTITVIVTE